MKLKDIVDSDIQSSLKENDIEVALDADGRIHVRQHRLDNEAKTGFLYLKPEYEIPKGPLPFLVVSAKGVYGIFHENKEALIIEVSFMAILGDKND